MPATIVDPPASMTCTLGGRSPSSVLERIQTTRPASTRTLASFRNDGRRGSARAASRYKVGRGMIMECPSSSVSRSAFKEGVAEPDQRRVRLEPLCLREECPEPRVAVVLLVGLVIRGDDVKEIILNAPSLLASAAGADEASLEEPTAAREVVPDRDLLGLAFEVVAPVGHGTLPAVQAASIGVPVVPRSAGTLEERFAQFAMLVPAFGGMYYAGDTLVVYLTKLAARPAALQAIGAVFGPAVLTSGGVEVRLATYGFLQLMQWHARMRSLFALPGVVMLDIDEMANRLKVGVAEAPISGTTSTASFRAVEVALTQLGVPRTAATIVPMQPFATSATLRVNTRGIEGGMQIAVRT